MRVEFRWRRHGSKSEGIWVVFNLQAFYKCVEAFMVLYAKWQGLTVVQNLGISLGIGVGRMLKLSSH